MKTLLATFLMVVTVATAGLSLTPQERQFIQTARGYVQKAKEQAIQEQKIQEAQIKRAELLTQTVDEQKAELGVLSKQVDDKQKEAEGLAKYNAYAKPIVEQVNKYWGIGAFGYGLKVLSRHLLVLLAVLVGLGLCVTVLSFVFPPVGAFLAVAWSFLKRLFTLWKHKK